MSFPKWFTKKSEEKKHEYCNEHPNSEVCRIFFGHSRDTTQRIQSVVREETVSIPVHSNSSRLTQEHDYYDTKSGHAWAKKSSVPNLGSDIDGSKRHTRNNFREWGDFSTPDSIERIMSNKFDHKQLKKLGGEQLKTQDRELAPSYWVILKVLDTYPSFKSGRMEKMKWAKDYYFFLEEGRKIAEKNAGNVDATYSEFIKFIREQVVRGHQAHEMYYDLDKPFTHKNSPIVKFLQALGAPVSRYSHDKNCKALQLLMGSAENKDKVVEILDGKSVNAVFGIDSSPRDSFKPEEFYSNFVPDRVEELSFKSFSDVKKFFETDGFKIFGMQFGNSLADKERTAHAIISAECLKDLAHVLNVPGEVITGDGALGIAISARGSRGALAHYEPGSTVINMTKTGGGGAFAHEMGHFFDNMLSRKFIGSKAEFLTGRPHFKFSNEKVKVVSDRLKNINDKVQRRIREDDDFKRCSKKQAEWALNSAECFARAFEAFVKRKADKLGVRNSYLVSLPKHYFWPTEEELDEYEGIFEDVIDLLKEDRQGSKRVA